VKEECQEEKTKQEGNGGSKKGGPRQTKGPISGIHRANRDRKEDVQGRGGKEEGSPSVESLASGGGESRFTKGDADKSKQGKGPTTMDKTQKREGKGVPAKLPLAIEKGGRTDAERVQPTKGAISVKKGIVLVAVIFGARHTPGENRNPACKKGWMEREITPWSYIKYLLRSNQNDRKCSGSSENGPARPSTVSVLGYQSDLDVGTEKKRGKTCRSDHRKVRPLTNTRRIPSV